LTHPKNIKLTLEYDGSDFAGWQRQKRQRTVQGEIEKAIGRLTGEKVSVIAAGRTDSGAHALGQVANFKTACKLPADKIRLALNTLLPKDILVKNVREINSNFNSRKDARAKLYRYRILLGASALQRGYLWQYRFPVSLKLLKRASTYLMGRKDFSSFCVAKSRKESNICKIGRATWKRAGSILDFEIEGDRFLHAMVRILAGTLLEVGRGRISPQKFKEILEAKDRRKAGRTAPAKGLYLVEVKF